jgi:hypothetical protein
MLSNVIISESPTFHMPFQFACPLAMAARTRYMARGSVSEILRNGCCTFPAKPKMLSRIVTVTEWMLVACDDSCASRYVLNAWASSGRNETGAGTYR